MKLLSNRWIKLKPKKATTTKKKINFGHSKWPSVGHLGSDFDQIRTDWKGSHTLPVYQVWTSLVMLGSSYRAAKPKKAKNVNFGLSKWPPVGHIGSDFDQIRTDWKGSHSIPVYRVWRCFIMLGSSYRAAKPKIPKTVDFRPSKWPPVDDIESDFDQTRTDWKGYHTIPVYRV